MPSMYICLIGKNGIGDYQGPLPDSDTRCMTNPVLYQGDVYTYSHKAENESGSRITLFFNQVDVTVIEG